MLAIHELFVIYCDRRHNSVGYLVGWSCSKL